MPEQCQRCGEIDEDRRTLWMACFYAMHELAPPFDRVAVRGRVCELVGTEKSRFGMLPAWGNPIGEDRDHSFYTLRVCKRCRAEWMTAIESWFMNPPRTPEGCGSGVYVRENGINVEITREEWDHRQSSRTPGSGEGE